MAILTFLKGFWQNWFKLEVKEQKLSKIGQKLIEICQKIDKNESKTAVKNEKT